MNEQGDNVGSVGITLRVNIVHDTIGFGRDFIQCIIESVTARFRVRIFAIRVDKTEFRIDSRKFVGSVGFSNLFYSDLLVGMNEEKGFS